MKKLNFTKSFEMLKIPITQGLYHSDIFYLYGEVCRILKRIDESEYYLNECLKFENFSPFVLFSLGLLYQEIYDYKKSNKYFKNFCKIIDSSDSYYQISKNYLQMNKKLKSAIYITKAINLNIPISIKSSFC